MPDTAKAHPASSLPTRGAAILALAFGALTILSGGTVLFGGEPVRAQAGAVVPFVLWFNFLAGFAYVAAAWGIWTRAAWAFPVSLAIAISTLVVAAVFALVVAGGADFEMRTVGALILRVFVWAGIALLIRPRRT